MSKERYEYFDWLAYSAEEASNSEIQELVTELVLLRAERNAALGEHAIFSERSIAGTSFVNCRCGNVESGQNLLLVRRAHAAHVLDAVQKEQNYEE